MPFVYFLALLQSLLTYDTYTFPNKDRDSLAFMTILRGKKLNISTLSHTLCALHICSYRSFEGSVNYLEAIGIIPGGSIGSMDHCMISLCCMISIL